MQAKAESFRPSLSIGRQPPVIPQLAAFAKADSNTLKLVQPFEKLPRLFQLKPELHAEVSDMKVPASSHVLRELSGLQDRFKELFRKVVQWVDPDSIHADYWHGVLRIAVKKKSWALPRRIPISSSTAETVSKAA